MNFFDLIIISLATWEIIEILHHSMLFANFRVKLELKDYKLLLCPFCLAPWLSWLLCGFILLREITIIPWLILLGLASARLANLGNDITYKYCRTPKDDKEIKS